MKKVLLALCGLLVLAGCCLSGWAQDGLAFGFGGGGVGALFPDLEGVNAFLSENGLGPMESPLVGGCGGGRGGVVGGPSFGGMGFGVVAESANADRSADLVVGAGGFDLGFAVGGDESSVLTVGAVLGGGASVLDFAFSGVEPAGDEPRGIVPEPLTRTVGRAFAMVMPYVDFGVELFGPVGLGLRIGYMLPVFGLDFGDDLGIPAPSLDFSGPYVSVSVTVGGIVRMGDAANDGKTTTSGTLELSDAARLSVESGIGEIVISSYPYSESQTGSRRVVEWQAAYEADGDVVPVEAANGPDGAVLRTRGEAEVSYVLRVPWGTSLELACGSGSVRVVGHSGPEIRVSLGVGDVALIDVDAEEVWASVGVGEIAIKTKTVVAMTAHAGIGRIRVHLPPDASASVAASVGIGEAMMDNFAGMALSDRGFLWSDMKEAVLGSGFGECQFTAGIGKVEVWVTRAPAA